MSSPAKRPLSRRAALARLAHYAAVAALPVTGAGAQQEPPPPEPAPETELPQTVPPKPAVPDLPPELLAEPVDSEEGYANWKHHIGKPEEAVCHVRVTVFDGGAKGGNGQTVREGSGVVVRCDGFVLLPEALFGDDRDLQKNAKISLTFRAADGTPPSDPMEPFAPPRFHSRKTDYVLVRVNGHHFKGLHLLDIRNLRLQMPVNVVWAAPARADAKNGAKKPASVPVARTVDAVVGGREPDSGAPHFGLTFGDGGAALADELRPPLGAAVIDPSCGAVLGIVTVSHAKAVHFSPFGYFRYVCNDVGLKFSSEDVSTPVANTQGTVTPTGQMLTMVKVLGGPIRLNAQAGTDYRFFYGTDVVCMPDFYIDAYPVTTGAYRDWLGQGGPRQPIGWVENIELRTRERNPDVPISGLIADDALRYAAGHKKRVATPVEWARATIGAKTKWIADLRGEWIRIAGMQDGIARVKAGFYASVLQEKAKQNKNSRTYKPPVGIAAPEPTLDALSTQQMQLYASYWKFKDRWMPWQHSPVGFYKNDVSRWGVYDVVSNAPEMCQPNFAARPFEPAPKPYATPVEPFISRAEVFGRVGYCTPGDMDMEYVMFAAGLGDVLAYIYYRDGVYTPGTMNVHGLTGAGFRCAL